MGKLSEADIERQCTDFLALDGWRSLKTDPVSRKEWGKGFGEPGMPDRLYIRYDDQEDMKPGTPQGVLNSPALRAIADVMWIEWKRPGKKAEAHQRLWHAAERARGALVLVAGADFRADFDTFVAWYRASGLLRRPGL